MLCSDLPLQLAISYYLRKDLVPRAQACSSVLVVVKIDEEKIITRANCA